MTREQALNVVKANVEDKALVRQILAAEEIMRALARRLGEDEDEWGLAGLLYDVDVELVQDDPSSHGRLSADIAGDLGAPATVVHAILCQGVDHSIAPETSLDKALYCVDPLCRLIMSVASLIKVLALRLTDSSWPYARNWGWIWRSLSRWVLWLRRMSSRREPFLAALITSLLL